MEALVETLNGQEPLKEVQYVSLSDGSTVSAEQLIQGIQVRDTIIENLQIELADARKQVGKMVDLLCNALKGND